MAIYLEHIDINIKMEKIRDVIKFAGDFQGKAFGEFVRKVIVPDDLTADCRSLNIWFNSKAMLKKFIFKAEEAFYLIKVEHNCYGLCYAGTHLIFLHLSGGPRFPVYDFDVNCLTYYYDCQQSAFVYGKEILTIRTDLLLECIRNKTTLMFPQYGKNLNKQNIKNINKTYLEKGWEIRYNGQIISQPLLTY